MDLCIWKWQLKMAQQQDLGMPVGAQLLSLQLQDGNPTLWFLCDPDAPIELRRFAIYGTGQVVPDTPREFLDTFQTGATVWHVFEVQHPSPTLLVEHRVDYEH